MTCAQFLQISVRGGVYQKFAPHFSFSVTECLLMGDASRQLRGGSTKPQHAKYETRRKLRIDTAKYHRSKMCEMS
jgi:hypothetical protein